MSDKDQAVKSCEIRIGLLHSLTGVMSRSERPVRYATEIALGELRNSNSGFELKLNNCLSVQPNLKIFTRDCQSDDRVSADMARELIYEDRADVLFGCWTSSGRRLVRRILESLDRILFYPVQYEGFEQSSHIVYLGATPNQQIFPALEWALERLSGEGRPFRYYLVGSDYVFPIAAHSIIDEFLQRYPVEKVGETLIPLEERTSNVYERVANQVKESDTTVLLNTINGRGNYLLFRVLQEQAVIGESSNLLMLSFSLGETELYEMKKKMAVGTYISDPFFDSIEGAHAKAMSFLSTKLGEKMGLPGGRYPVSAAAQKAYLSVYLWKLALKKSARSAKNLPEALATERMRRALSGLPIPKAIDPDGGEMHTTNLHTSKRPRIGLIGPASVTVCMTSEKLVPPLPFVDRVPGGHIERFLVSEARDEARRGQPKSISWIALRDTKNYEKDSKEIGACFAVPEYTLAIHDFKDMFDCADQFKGMTFLQAEQCKNGELFIKALNVAKSYMMKLARSDYDLRSVLATLAVELSKQEVPRWEDLAVAMAKIKAFLYRDAPIHIRAPKRERKRHCKLFLLDLLDYISQVLRGTVWFHRKKVKALSDLVGLARATDEELFAGEGDEVAKIVEVIPINSEISHEIRFTDDGKYIRYLFKIQKAPVSTPRYERFFVKNASGDLSDMARLMTKLVRPSKREPWMLHRCPREEIDMWDRSMFKEGFHVLIWASDDQSRYFLDLITCRDFMTRKESRRLGRQLAIEYSKT